MSSGVLVVIGAGTAGSTVAAHLAAATTWEIVLVEPGTVSESDDTPGFFDVLTGADTWPLDGYQQPRVVGGGSAVNAMVLSGEAPPHLAGLTRMATDADMGPAARALLAAGGRATRLWWNGGRWNPGRAVAHLVDEGRIEHRRTAAERIDVRNGRAAAVVTRDGEIPCDQVVVTAGAILTPALLLRSGLDRLAPTIGVGLQNHPSLAVVFHALAGGARFDASVVHDAVTSNGRRILTIAYERASAHDPDVGLLMSSLMDVESRGRVMLDDGELKFDFGDLSTTGDRVAHTEMGRRLVDLADECGFMVHGLAAPAMVSHAASSCVTAVNRAGRLHGTDNVTVADASVLGTVPPETPAAAVTMEALRIAATLGEELT